MWRRCGAVILVGGRATRDQFVFAIRETFKFKLERFVFGSRVSRSEMRAAGKANDTEVRPAIDIDRACDDAADSMSALSAIADIDTGRLFAGPYFDLRRGLSRRRRIIGWRIE